MSIFMYVCVVFACHLTSTLGIKVSWDPFHPD